MKLADLPQIQALSLNEKIELVEELWLAIGPEIESLEVSSGEKRLLDERWERYLENPGSALTLEQLENHFRTARP